MKSSLWYSLKTLCHAFLFAFTTHAFAQERVPDAVGIDAIPSDSSTAQIDLVGTERVVTIHAESARTDPGSTTTKRYMHTPLFLLKRLDEPTAKDTPWFRLEGEYLTLTFIMSDPAFRDGICRDAVHHAKPSALVDPIQVLRWPVTRADVRLIDRLSNDIYASTEMLLQQEQVADMLTCSLKRDSSVTDAALKGALANHRLRLQVDYQFRSRQQAAATIEARGSIDLKQVASTVLTSGQLTREAPIFQRDVNQVVRALRATLVTVAHVDADTSGTLLADAERLRGRALVDLFTTEVVRLAGPEAILDSDPRKAAIAEYLKASTNAVVDTRKNWDKQTTTADDSTEFSFGGELSLPKVTIKDSDQLKKEYGIDLEFKTTTNEVVPKSVNIYSLKDSAGSISTDEVTTLVRSLGRSTGYRGPGWIDPQRAGEMGDQARFSYASMRAVCADCKGHGRVTCDQCHGYGRLACTTCQSIGMIAVERKEPYLGTTTCLSCNGHGVGVLLRQNLAGEPWHSIEHVKNLWNELHHSRRGEMKHAVEVPSDSFTPNKLVPLPMNGNTQAIAFCQVCGGAGKLPNVEKERTVRSVDICTDCKGGARTCPNFSYVPGTTPSPYGPCEHGQRECRPCNSTGRIGTPGSRQTVLLNGQPSP